MVVIGAHSDSQAASTLLIMSWNAIVLIVMNVITVIIITIITSESKAAAAHHATGAHLLCSDTWHHSED